MLPRRSDRDVDYLSPEARLLLETARVDAPPSAEYLERLASHGLSWARVAEIATEQRLLPVVWKGLGNVAANSGDPDLQKVRQYAAITEFHMAGVSEALGETLVVLNEAGIQVMLLKGSALVQTIYHGFSDRPVADLDILVPERDAERAWHELIERGWTQAYGEREAFWEGMHHLPPLMSQGDRPTPVEIHRTIIRPGPFEIDHDGIWDRSRTIQLHDGSANLPATEDMLLHLSIHLAWSDMLSKGLVRSLRDVGRIIKDEGVDWPALVNRGRSAKATSALYWTLRLTRELVGGEVPFDVLADLAPKSPVPSRLLERWLTASALDHACPSVTVRQWCWSAAMRPAISGQGDLRPWHDGERWVTLMGTSEGSPPLHKRVLGQLGNAGAWARFLALPARKLGSRGED